ncbi:bifunctional helix-turn-helix domain-containing protein/methylated-DNA--[protein]-cysteine S-methyltransferase [Pseudoroseicyclus tamaricis]|uniref:methylated-DNA--[protein]-cysteine S-methyltransferase n=1 Tax=Pseudoroseicyclus tamaricis TaxID=2705421 RepID=A0A6B2JTK7_9RHOB|nr:bifunctional helix-turn-helix domain-containing protein/methylated-DNA--[protein]-cysteine S-methyltransferase [Pseudoroseicyclus tamaricis]NDV01887.1 methylated-DNA--[protein]-cysteine S-methyltransferase [Pseudoroseicyclus tamaricis]
MSSPTRFEENGYHYHVMARAIAEIDAAARDGGGQLSLEELAGRMQMSPAHFQRLFTAWAGVSPKRLQQYLALGHAKALLEARFTTLEAAEGAGLSGTGRLHDLFLRWEAMSPGAFARGGEGLVIRWGRFASPFGPVLAMGTERGLCGLAFTAETGEAPALAELMGRWPGARYAEAPEALEGWVAAAFGGGGEVALTLTGGPFQIKVWEALMRIPSGNVTTYSEIAASIGHPKAVRAVGTAVGRNPIGYLIPCHRALRKSGGLGGYHWGLPVKRAMLAWETARAEAG